MMCPKIICEHHKLSRENVLKKTKSSEILFIPHNNNHEFDNQIIMTKRNTKYCHKIDPLVFHGSIELQKLKFVFLFGKLFMIWKVITYITNKIDKTHEKCYYKIVLILIHFEKFYFPNSIFSPKMRSCSCK